MSSDISPESSESESTRPTEQDLRLLLEHADRAAHAERFDDADNLRRLASLLDPIVSGEHEIMDPKTHAAVPLESIDGMRENIRDLHTYVPRDIPLLQSRMIDRINRWMFGKSRRGVGKD